MPKNLFQKNLMVSTLQASRSSKIDLLVKKILKIYLLSTSFDFFKYINFSYILACL